MFIGGDAIARWAIAQSSNIPMINAGVFSATGAGLFAPTLNSFAAAVHAAAGSGAAAFGGASNISGKLTIAGAGAMAPILHSFDGAVFATAGISGTAFGGTALFPSVLTTAGSAHFLGVMYAFFVDAEVACVHEEIRSVLIGPENRITGIAAEDRLYEVDINERGAQTPNRKRSC